MLYKQANEMHNAGGVAMDAPEHFEAGDRYATFRPVATCTFKEAVERVRVGITYCAGQKIAKVLVDTTHLTGFDYPDTLERFGMAEQLSRSAQGVVIVALVARAELIDPQHFGITVARNRGTLAEVFDSEPEAVAWLLRHPAS